MVEGATLNVVSSPYRVGLYLQLRKGAKFTRVLYPHCEVNDASRLVGKLDSGQNFLTESLLLAFVPKRL
jgi:hypothetical protein